MMSASIDKKQIIKKCFKVFGATLKEHNSLMYFDTTMVDGYTLEFHATMTYMRARRPQKHEQLLTGLYNLEALETILKKASAFYFSPVSVYRMSTYKAMRINNMFRSKSLEEMAIILDLCS